MMQAEGEGLEPPDRLSDMSVFKTGAIPILRILPYRSEIAPMREARSAL